MADIDKTYSEYCGDRLYVEILYCECCGKYLGEYLGVNCPLDLCQECLTDDEHRDVMYVSEDE